MKNAVLALATLPALLLASPVLAGDYLGSSPYGGPPKARSSAYVGVFGGYAKNTFGELRGSITDLDTSDLTQAAYETWDTHGSLSDGFMVGATLGARIGSNFRTELEVSYLRQNTSDDSTFTCTLIAGTYCVDNFAMPSATTTRTGTGTLGSTFVLANFWYDLIPDAPFTPYLGAGVGIARVSGAFNSSFVTSDEAPTDYLNQSVNGWAPAFQGGAGIRWNVMRNVALDVGYRYKAVVNVPVTTTSSHDGIADATVSASDRLSFGVHAVQAGVSFGF